jgi:hypothetical protein
MTRALVFLASPGLHLCKATKSPSNCLGPFLQPVCRLLVKLGRDAREGVVELGAKAIDDRDDCDRNARLLSNGSRVYCWLEQQRRRLTRP